MDPLDKARQARLLQMHMVAQRRNCTNAMVLGALGTNVQSTQLSDNQVMQE